MSPFFKTLGGLALSAMLSVAHAISLGDIAPAITATHASGAAVSVAAPAAKLTYIDFWASWCAPCKQSFPWMDAMHEKYGKAGLRVLAITVDKKREDADKFLKQANAKFEIGFDPDGKTAAAYTVKAMPTSLLIDEKGKVIFVHSGFRASDTEDLEAQIKAALDAATLRKP